MIVETEKKGTYRDTHSKGLIIPKNDAYMTYLNKKKTNKRLNHLEEKMDKILELLEGKQSGTT